METIKGRITHATKTESEWNKSTVVLLKGEVGFASDTQVIKVGNGVDTWKNLKSHQGGKGDQGDPLTIKTTATLSNGDTKITFSDGKTLTIPKGETGDRGVKGDNLTISSTTKDSQGNTVITFSDGTKTTINKGDKGDPLTFDDLTPEQINQIKAQDIDLSNYVTKDDLASVDVSGQLADYAKKDHKHTITDITNLQTTLNGKASSTHTHDEYVKKDDANSEYVNMYSKFIKNVGVNSDGFIVYNINGKWYLLSEGSSYRQPLAFKDHTHPNLVDDVFFDNGKLVVSKNGTGYEVGDRLALADHTHEEYLKKGDPIELTASQKAELKGEPGKQGNPGTPGRDGTSITTWTGTQAQYDRISSKSNTTLYIIKG